MAKRRAPAAPAQVSRDDLQRGFQSLQDGLKREVDTRKSTFMSVAGGAGVLLVILVFVLGRRSGKKKTTFVEIRRV